MQFARPAMYDPAIESHTVARLHIPAYDTETFGIGINADFVVTMDGTGEWCESWDGDEICYDSENDIPDVLQISGAVRMLF